MDVQEPNEIAAPLQTAGCALCGLDTGRDPFRQVFDDGAEKLFCCLGCLNVYAILLESGVVSSGVDLRSTDLYQRSLALGLVSAGKPGRPLAAIPPDTAVEERLFHISGMWCSSCAWLIEHILKQERGIEGAEVFFVSDLLKVRYYPQYLPPGRVKECISRVGYRATEFNPGRESAEPDGLLLRLGIAAFLWVNVMVMNLAVYLGYFDQMPPSFRSLLPFVTMALASPVVFYCAQPILHAAWLGLRRGQARMETLLSLGILTAFTYSSIQAARGGTHIYFDIACAIVTLLLLGKYIEHGARQRTSRAVTSLYRMLPKKARILADGRERFVAVETLKPGDVFVVKAGERVPADGVVLDGDSHLDESLLTGESLPVAKSEGSPVAGGAVNTSGVLQVRVERAGPSSALAQIVRLVEQALSGRSEIERIVDRVARVFVPGVMALAATTFVTWVWAGLPVPEALMRAISVLMIACPCALGIATPLALTAAVGKASRRGILVADSRVLDTVPRVDAVVLDKTGTVTEGIFELVDYKPEHLARVASLEAYSEHPLGMAVVRRAKSLGCRLEPAENVHIEKGQGILGQVGGHRIFAGSARFVAWIDSAFKPGAEMSGGTVVYYGWDGRVQGALAFGDRVREDAKDVVASLQARGVLVYLVSGDSHAATSSVAGQLGIDTFSADTLPQEKVAFVTRLRGQGKVVAMVGDGINDAPALAAADLGIAMSSGTDLAMKAAALVLTGGRLSKILEAFDLTREARVIVRQNLFWAFFYNLAGITFAVAGWLSPIVAAVAMVLSSLFVTVNSYRSFRE